jgi:uncharacterized membrane protein
MSSIRSSLGPLFYSVSITVLAVLAMWPWLQGPSVVGLACFGGTAGARIIDDRVSKRTVAWRTALGQGLVCGLAVWGTSRWLSH